MSASIIAPITINEAFRFMELGALSSFADDTPQAQDAENAYPSALRACLESCDWTFASFTVDLPEVAASMLPTGWATLPDLPYSFAVPGGSARLIEVGDRWTKWRREGNFIRASDPAPLTVRYTVETLPEADQPATFRTAVAARLAELMAPRWNGSQANSDQAEQRAAIKLAAAKTADARQASPARYDGRVDEGDWVEMSLR